jgi:hypothetical protein
LAYEANAIPYRPPAISETSPQYRFFKKRNPGFWSWALGVLRDYLLTPQPNSFWKNSITIGISCYWLLFIFMLIGLDGTHDTLSLFFSILSAIRNYL